ncbi:hypothetical protein AA16663_0106 [Komagataeibacter rhaeticus DSM 16663]|nr:hypothetical protein AA16663_0106 [Komagataeibacter rhaeticus DSM 16663]
MRFMDLAYNIGTQLLQAASGIGHDNATSVTVKQLYMQQRFQVPDMAAECRLGPAQYG